jgi:hypothetical protein
MAVYARPDEDITVTVWTDQAAGTTNLWNAVDETSVSESDYVTATMTGVDPYEDQVGNTNNYTTPLGTACKYREIAPGGNTDHYHRFLIFTPNSLTLATPTPQVIYFHGATATERQVLTSTGPNNMLNSWLDRGWSVASLRLGTTVNPDGTDENDGKWGNALMRDGVSDILAWLAARFAQHANGWLFYGFSAGGVNGINAAMEAKDDGYDVAALAMCDPATNLAWCYDVNYESSIPHTQSGASAAIRSQIIGAYSISTNGGTGGGRPYSGTPPDAEWTSKVDTDRNGHDPQRVALSELPSVPIYLSASTGDTLIEKDRNTDYFYTRLLAAAWAPEIVNISYGGAHGATAHFLPTETNEFYDRALT